MIKRINKFFFYCRVNDCFLNVKYNILWEYLKSDCLFYNKKEIY